MSQTDPACQSCKANSLEGAKLQYLVAASFAIGAIGFGSLLGALGLFSPGLRFGIGLGSGVVAAIAVPRWWIRQERARRQAERRDGGRRSGQGSGADNPGRTGGRG